MTWWPWPLTLKINRVSDSLKDKVCTKFYQNRLKDVDSNVHKVKIRPSDLDLWPMTLKINRVPDSAKYVPSLVKIHWRTLILECSQGCYSVTNLTWWPWPLTLKINRVSDSLTDKVCTKFYQNPLKDVYSSVHKVKIRPWPWPLAYDLEIQ